MLARVRFALKDFPGFAKIRRLGLLLEPWTVDNGMLTPTLKVKRNQVQALCAEHIAMLYEDGPT
jgi:long-chain acyl-CoA synthetase